MSRKIAAVLFLILFFLSLTDSLGAARQRRHWEETQTETIWRVRYTNCDYGYYVSLPTGVVAHGTHAPAPNHGFLISLPEASRTSAASVEESRFLWVDASYNSTDYHSLRDVANYDLDLAKADQHGFRVLEHGSTTLAGLPAVRFRVQYERRGQQVIEEHVVALRSGIVYTVGLRTLEASRVPDEKQFEKIRDGFKLIKLPQGQCSNG